MVEWFVISSLKLFFEITKNSASHSPNIYYLRKSIALFNNPSTYYIIKVLFFAFQSIIDSFFEEYFIILPLISKNYLTI